jgi:uncharacterized membrane protein
MEKEQKTILQIYYALIASVILSVLPSSVSQTFGFILFIVIFMATYYFRHKSDEKSLTHNHMQFIIKSIWISSLILLIGMGPAYVFADHQIIYDALNHVRAGNFLTESQINSILMDYMKTNLFIFLFTLVPCLIYLVYRLCKGLAQAQKKEFIPNLKSWL